MQVARQHDDEVLVLRPSNYLTWTLLERTILGFWHGDDTCPSTQSVVKEWALTLWQLFEYIVTRSYSSSLGSCSLHHSHARHHDPRSAGSSYSSSFKTNPSSLLEYRKGASPTRSHELTFEVEWVAVVSTSLTKTHLTLETMHPESPLEIILFLQFNPARRLLHLPQRFSSCDYTRILILFEEGIKHEYGFAKS